MPKGIVHDKIALLFSFPTLIAGFCLFKDLGLAITLTLSSIIYAFLLSPDLDTKSFSYYRWSFLRFVWLPYRKLIPHRSRFSHSLLLAPFIKILYLSVITILILGLIAVIFSHFSVNTHLSIVKSYILSNFKYFLPYISAVLMGFIWANAQHVIADTVFSYYKNHFKL